MIWVLALAEWFSFIIVSMSKTFNPWMHQQQYPIWGLLVTLDKICLLNWSHNDFRGTLTIYADHSKRLNHMSFPLRLKRNCWFKMQTELVTLWWNYIAVTTEQFLKERKSEESSDVKLPQTPSAAITPSKERNTPQQ